jgi:hypothetical protein
LWLSIGKIVDEETIKLGVNATPQFIGALTEMVWAQIGKCTPTIWASSRLSASMSRMIANACCVNPVGCSCY